MEPSSPDQHHAAPKPPPRSPGRQLIRALYTNNPFYLISAWLVFSGLRASFNTGGDLYQTWALLGGLASYTVLLAAAACVLIRLGSVWEDVRTLLLLVLLMFLAISVSLDEALTTSPGRGSLWLTAGLAFAMAVSEVVRVGLRVRLPLAYRIPYYLVLALFFLYPVALAPWVGRPASGPLQWGLFAFPTAAGLAFLTLLPAIRRGATPVGNNGTPWSWPWYPLSLFFVLAVAVCLRAHYLCLSLHFVGGDWSIFGGYFLVPFLLAVNVLWLELGLAMQKRRVVGGALAVPLVWLWLSQAATRGDAVYLGFLHEFQRALHATPLYVTLALTLAFFGVAALRQVQGALQACLATATAMSLIGPRTLTFAGPYEVNGWPLLAVAGVLVVWAARRRESLAAAVAAVMFVVGSAIELRGTWFTSFGLTPFGEVIPLELLLTALLLAGTAFHDAHAPIVRLTAAGLLVWVSGTISAGQEGLFGDAGWLASTAHFLFWTAIAVAYARWLRAGYFYLAAGTNAAVWGFMTIVQGYGFLRTRVAGLPEISLGLVFFVLAFLVSVWKVIYTTKLPPTRS